MEIIVEDFISGQQTTKIVPDDTIFISKNGRNYYQGETIYKVVSPVKNIKNTNIINLIRNTIENKVVHVHPLCPVENVVM